MTKLIAGLFIIVSLHAAADASRATLKIRPYSRVIEVSKVSLLEVVDRDGLTAEDQKKLALISLGDAPKVGEQRIYSNKVIAEALRQSVPKKNWNIQIPREVVVDNKGYQLDRETLEAELLSKWQTQCEECQIEIKNLQLPALNPKVKDLPWRAEISNQLPRGHFSQKITFTEPSGQNTIYWVSGQVEIRKKVPVLIRSTPMNTRFSEDDFKWEWRDVTFATDTTPTATEISGQMARFTMNASDIIWRNSLLKEKAVQRGEIVKVYIGEADWQVSVQARAEQDAYTGDTINLRNLQTNKMISGRVIGFGEVEIR